MNSLKFLAILVVACTVVLSGFTLELKASEQIKVTAETYIRAEVDGRMAVIQKRAGDRINAFFIIRRPTPVEGQVVVRMNRDTLYGGAVVDTAGGAAVYVPEMPDDRYFSLYLIDNDHYVVDVITSSGKHKIPEGTTKYVIAVARIQILDPGDEEELQVINNLLDQFAIEAKSADKFVPPNWDWNSMMALRDEYEKEFVSYGQYPADWMDIKGKASEESRHLAAAGAFGLFPETEATYINYTGPKDSSKCYTATYDVPPNEAFWSISVYGSDAFLKSDNATINDRTATFNEDGTVTVFFGSEQACGQKDNRIAITDGWNFLMRVYRPGEQVLKHQYKLPDVSVYAP
ncbi:DUF1214 domain-containing protein [Desulforhopalus singaporensis]|uniref:DUF1214 domain-containing protein n=1 Tax=Desulforhopalus singaporensis TaxID=91360 RepID=A0A1H0VGD0_9BACT|nr:DUF1214 domain-containing protein [Desulforhopalus singaporensis]SDP77411.1 Protein of unknown function [Desulforhopalus singaporensis]